MKNKVYNLALRFKRKYFGTIAFRLRAHSNILAKHINPDEKLLYVFCGQKGYSNREIFSTCVVALTNERIIIATKRVLWGYFLTSVTPDLFNDLKVQAGMFFGKVIIDTAKELIIISNLSKDSLREVETAVSSYMVKEKKKLKDWEKNQSFFVKVKV